MGLKPSKLIILIVLIIGVGAGCSHPFYSGLSKEEKEELNKANKAFYSELKKVISETDEIQIFDATEKEISLKKTYKKSDPEFPLLVEGFINASTYGTVAKTISDRKIFLLSKSEKKYEFECCTVDRRIEKRTPEYKKTPRYFISEHTIKYIK